jgi:hypothetical protein
MAALYGFPAQYPLGEVQCPLPTAAPRISKETTFTEIMSTLLSQGVFAQEPEDVGYSCIAYTLYRCAACGPGLLRYTDIQAMP